MRASIQEIIEWSYVRYCYCEAKVCSSSVGVVYVVHLRIVFSKAALQKRGSMEPMEPPLDPPLRISSIATRVVNRAQTMHGTVQYCTCILTVTILGTLSTQDTHDSHDSRDTLDSCDTLDSRDTHECNINHKQ